MAPLKKKSTDTRALLDVIQFTEEVSTRIYGLENDTDIFDTVCREFIKTKYRCSMLRVDEDRQELWMGCVSVKPAILKLAEKLSGQKVKTSRLDVSGTVIYNAIVNKRETVCCPVLDIFRDAIPKLDKPAIGKIGSVLGLDALCISSPLVVNDKVVGVFGISSPGVSQEMVPFIRNFAHHISAALALAEETRSRKHAEKELQASLAEKDKMLRESHHRVRDNLQIITSLLDLQGRALESGEVRDMLHEVRNRIRSIAFVHEGLYASPDFSHIKLENYFSHLVKGIFRTYGVNPGEVNYIIHPNNIDLHVSQAIPLGLVVNELVTNALKHAFPPDKAGPHQVEVKVSRTKDRITARVSNNGVPFPPEVDVESAGTFGLQLVQLLVTSQLEGTMKIDKTGEPACNVTFPVI